MNISELSPGKNPPSDINVVIEIPQHSGAIKYEVDKDSGALLVDRFLGTAMVYPASYGFIPNTLAEDGDPADVLVLSPVAPVAGSVMRCRPIGMLKMEDDGGMDEKILAVPVAKLSPMYDKVESLDDIPQPLLDQIQHFFEHYKDLEKGKWVKIQGWQDKAAAEEMIAASVKRAG